ncbi:MULTISPECIES: hypothetical protein, partial [Pseudomonas putida group]|uniref:hypothetical protein n=1 Tax=Pseudomonas putida group TaxID=136845 RepID=UPI001E578E27
SHRVRGSLANPVLCQISFFRHFLRTNKVLPTPTPPRNIPQKAIILPTQTFNFFESYINATSMYARTTFLAPTIPPHIALGTPPA